MPFNSFMDHIENKSNTKGVFYLQHQNGNFQTEFTDLSSDVDGEIPWISEAMGSHPDVGMKQFQRTVSIACSTVLMFFFHFCNFSVLIPSHFVVNIWIGTEQSTSSLHKDPYENFYVVITGQKKFTLLPPT